MVLSLESAIPKKNQHQRGKLKRTIRDSGIFRENMVNGSRPQIEAALLKKREPRLLF